MSTPDSQPTTSIVTLNWDHMNDLTGPFIESLVEWTPNNIQLIVVDQGSNDGDIAVLKRYADEYEWLTPIYLSFNVGFPRGCNIGAEAAYGDVLIWMNNDIQIYGEWLNEILDRLSANERRVIGASLIDRRTGWNVVDGVTIPYIEGWLFAVMRAAFIYEVGFFDEDFGIGGMEDVDLSWRASRSGYGLVEVPSLPLIHLRGATVNDGRLDQFAITSANREKFVEKYRATNKR